MNYDDFNDKSVRIDWYDGKQLCKNSFLLLLLLFDEQEDLMKLLMLFYLIVCILNVNNFLCITDDENDSL